MAYLPLATAASFGAYGAPLHLYAAYGQADFQSGQADITRTGYENLSKKALNAQIKATKKALRRAQMNKTAPNYRQEVLRLQALLNALLKERQRRKTIARMSTAFQQSDRRGKAKARITAAQRWQKIQSEGLAAGRRGRFTEAIKRARAGQAAPSIVAPPRRLPPILQFLTQAIQPESAQPEVVSTEVATVDLEPTLSDYLTPVNIAIAAVLVGGGVYLYRTRKGAKKRK
jgi:hypothetical protein